MQTKIKQLNKILWTVFKKVKMMELLPLKKSALKTIELKRQKKPSMKNSEPYLNYRER